MIFELARGRKFRAEQCVYLSANRFPTTWENSIRTSSFVFCLPTTSEKGIRTSIFVFRFPTTYIENWIRTSTFVFGFPTTLDNRIVIAISVFRFHKILKNGIWTSIFVFRFLVFVTSVFLLNRFLSLTKCLETTDDVFAGITNKMAALENIFDEVFVYSFLWVHVDEEQRSNLGTRPQVGKYC